MKNGKKIYVITPNIGMAIVLAIPLIALLYHGVETGDWTVAHKGDVRLLAVLGLFAFPPLCIGYTLFERCLVIHFLGIPIRNIRWSHCESVEFIPSNKEKPARICIATQSCCLQIFQDIYIRIPKGMEEKYINAFKQCVDTIIGID